MSGIDLHEVVALKEKSQFAQATDDTSGTSLFSSNIPEAEVYIPLGLILSDTSGSANSVDLSKSGEASETFHGTFNLAGNETRTVGAGSVETLVPRLEGGSNLDITANSDGVEATLVYVPNTEV